MKRYEGNFSISYIIKYTFAGFTSNKDAEEIQEWFKVCLRALTQIPSCEKLTVFSAYRARTSPSSTSLWINRWIPFVQAQCGGTEVSRISLAG